MLLFSGGWPILRNFNPDDFDYSQVLKQLQVKYGVYPYFKISVESNPGAPGNSSIRMSPSGLGLPDKKYYFTLDDPVSSTRDCFKINVIEHVLISDTKSLHSIDKRHRNHLGQINCNECRC